MEAIVLAGGFGTRLRSVVMDIPKPMAPIGNTPFLEYILKYLKKNSVTRVILSVGYKWEFIRNYFGNNFNDIELVYSIEDAPLGTGGAILKAINKIQGKEFYILNGDTFFNIDLNNLSLENNNKLILSLKKMHDFDRYGCVETTKDGMVTSFNEKEYRKSGNINGGIYLANTELFSTFSLDENFSFEQFMRNNFNQMKISTKTFDSYFVDIGIPEDYQQAQNEIKKYI